MAKISLIVNGNPVNANVDPRTLLVQLLRENLRLTGTHVGCDTSQCGACVVHLDGKAVKACTTLAVMADGHEVRTIEGLAAEGSTLWIGFRGPVLRHGYVPVLRVNAANYPTITREALLFVALGGRGIRDLVRVSGGFLVLAGPVGDSEQSTQLVFWDGRSCVAGADVPACVTKVLGEVAPVSGANGALGRAEGVAVLDDGASFRVLVVFDGVQGGAPTEFVVAR